jgi:hypothetical protein
MTEQSPDPDPDTLKATDGRPVITAMAAHAFAEHSRAVHGTPTPRRSTELIGSRHA